jgi:hypothetical protein
MADGIRATPYRYGSAGTANDIIGGLLGYLRDPRRTQQMQGLAGLLESTGIPKTVERLAYGEPLTNLQQANVPTLRPETAEALMALLPLPSGTSRAAMAAGRAGERMAERVVPRVMERGGVPAGLLDALATNTTSQMFIGPSSPMFNKDLALKASQMEKKGAKPQEIWQATGTVRGPDGQLRQEISDEISFTKGGGDFEETIMNAYDRGTQRTGNQLYKTTVDDVFYNRELASAYPELMGMETRTTRQGSDAYGSLAQDLLNNEQFLSVRKDLSPKQARSTMLHELQHAIQEQEGFAVGGNTNTMDRLIGKAKDRDFLIRQSEEWQKANKSVDDLYNKYFTNELTIEEVKAAEKQLQKQYPILLEQIDASDAARKIGSDPVDAYKRLMGEAEARLTQTRADLTPEQRKQYFPFEFQDEIRNPYGLDVPPEWLINLDNQGRLIGSGLLDR